MTEIAEIESGAPAPKKRGRKKQAASQQMAVIDDAESTLARLEAEALDEIDNERVETAISAKFGLEFVNRLKKFTYYVSEVGLQVDEACLLAGLNYEKFEQIRAMEPLIDEIVKKKELEFKKDLMLTIANTARKGDDDRAGWLLERRYPSEFGKGKKQGDGEDFLAVALKFIQKNGDSNPLVNETAGQAVILQKGGTHRAIDALSDALQA